MASILKTSISILFFYFITVTYAKDPTDYYKILGLSKSASNAEIKKAYAKLSLEHHPDKGGDQKLFLKISEAYRILKEKETRDIYDRYGQDGLDQHAKHEEFKQKQEFHSESDKKGENLNAEIHVSLEQIFEGSKIEVDVLHSSLCNKCFGLGAMSESHIHKCDKCDGKGVQTIYMRYAPNFVMKSEQTCDKCGGTGKIVAKKCDVCHGTKFVPEEKTVTVEIERGVKNGDNIILENEGDESVSSDPGDIILKVATMPHKIFERKGDDLHFEYHISLKQALLGFKVTVDGLSGEKYVLERNSVTRPGYVDRIPRKGMFIKGGNARGDLVVKYWVDFPETISAPTRSLVEQINL